MGADFQGLLTYLAMYVLLSIFYPYRYEECTLIL